MGRALAGRRVLVIGASAGIGRSFALQALAGGAHANNDAADGDDNDDAAVRSVDRVVMFGHRPHTSDLRVERCTHNGRELRAVALDHRRHR